MDFINLPIEEKAQILAWKSENVFTYEISRRTGQGESSIRCLIVAAWDLPPNSSITKSVLED